MIIDLGFVLDLIITATELKAKLEEVRDILLVEGAPAYIDWSYEDRKQMLKDCTRIVANLGLDLACYPMGYTTTILFDQDGNPVP